MILPKHTTSVLTRAELNDVLGRRWDYVPRSERMAIYRARMDRMRLERTRR